MNAEADRERDVQPAAPLLVDEPPTTPRSVPTRTHQLWIRVYDWCPHEGRRTDLDAPSREGL